ncbi:MAG: ribosome recycling factor [Bryobacteraceae bacterium]|nr:ribosome recycling factor [Bryobacteraceae bacterium]
MTVKEVEAHIRTKMEKTVADLQVDVSSLRTGRANVGMLDSVLVEYYGTPTPLNQVANMSVPEPALIAIQPWDASLIGPIEKAIRSAELGLNPANDGKLIRIPIPPLNEERRKEIVKRLHTIAEQHRVALRSERRDGNEKLKKMLKDKAISEDDERRALDEIQKLTDAHMAKVDAIAKSKEKDILEVK